MFGTLCQILKTRPATIHLTAIDDDGEVVELHISAQAARLLELDLHADPPDAARIREILAQGEQAVEQSPSQTASGTKLPALTATTGATTLSCPDCGLSYGAFVDTNRFGCATCYSAFEENLDAALEEIHGARTHVGRMPAGATPDAEARHQHRRLVQQQLDDAVADERYEDAARLRDELQRLEDGS